MSIRARADGLGKRPVRVVGGLTAAAAVGLLGRFLVGAFLHGFLAGAITKHQELGASAQYRPSNLNRNSVGGIL